MLEGRKKVQNHIIKAQSVRVYVCVCLCFGEGDREGNGSRDKKKKHAFRHDCLKS